MYGNGNQPYGHRLPYRELDGEVAYRTNNHVVRIVCVMPLQVIEYVV